MRILIYGGPVVQRFVLRGMPEMGTKPASDRDPKRERRSRVLGQGTLRVSTL